MQSQFEVLQQQNSGIERLKILMLAWENGNVLEYCLDFEKKKRASMKESLAMKSCAMIISQVEEFAGDLYAAACQELRRRRSDIRMNTEVAVKSGAEGAIL